MKRSAIFLGSALVALSLIGASSAAPVPLAGDLDPSFGTGGSVTFNGGTIAAVAVQPDGKIVVAGTSSGNEFQLARFLPDGSPDPSFGDRGYVETQIGESALASAVALQADGPIVVAGGSWQNTSEGDLEVDEEFTVARYEPNGSLDTSFGTGGVASTVIPDQLSNACFPSEAARVHALALSPAGDILAAGLAEWDDGCLTKFSDSSSFALVRYTPSGSLDSTFGDGGFALAAGGDSGLAVQPDGEIVAGEGESLVGYTPDGSENVGFNPAPKLQFNEALTLQDGKVVVAGVSPGGTGSGDLVVARFKRNGHVDTSFGAHGSTVIKRAVGLPNAIVTQEDSKLVIASSGAEGGFSGLVRLLPNGRLDAHFGRGGIVPFGDPVTGLASQPDGKVLVGTGTNGTPETLSRRIGGDNCVVPGVRGETVSRARATLQRSYCSRGRVSRRYSSKVARGRIISTKPGRGARLPHGTKVGLVVSSGRRGAG